MTIHIVPTNPCDRDVFLISGALNVKTYDSHVQEGDVVYIKDMESSKYIGPFKPENCNVGAYYGTGRSIWQILCRVDSDIRVADDPPMEQSSEIPLRVPEQSVTGSLELDGLIRNARFDSKRNRYHVDFEKDVKDLASHYASLLKSAGISTRILNKRFLYFEDNNLCERCISRESSEDPSFIIGLIAPRIYKMKSKSGRDAPLDLTKSRCIRDVPDEIALGFRDGSNLFFSTNAYGKVCISSMCLKDHPMNSILFPEIDFEFNSGPVYSDSEGCDEMRFFASAVLMEELFRMCGYDVESESISDICRHVILNKGESVYDLILVPTLGMWLSDVLESHPVPIDSHIICTKDPSPSLRIMILMDAIASDFDPSSLEIKGHHLDMNENLPVEPALIREMKRKIDHIWSV